MTTTTALRKATADDITARLTGIEGRRYRMTAENALGWGMGDAQLGISTALTEAIAQGRVEVVDVRQGVRYVRATEKALTEDRSGIACAPDSRVSALGRWCRIHNHFSRPTAQVAPTRTANPFEAARLSDQAARESGCDTCAKGCYCEIGSGGCEHSGCWGIGRDDTSGIANTCPAYLAAHARLTSGAV